MKTIALRSSRVTAAISILGLAIICYCAFLTVPADAQSVRPPANAVNVAPADPQAVDGQVPGGAKGGQSDSSLWRQIREGDAFNSSARGGIAGQLVQSEGEIWQKVRNGPLQNISVLILAGMIILIGFFYLIRGRIMIEHGRSGETIERFNGIERFGHWLLAVSFIVLAFTGLWMLLGRSFIIPLVGKETFATVAVYGKLAHNYLAFAFMLGLVLIFVCWVLHNIPTMTDVRWLMKGGGLFSKGSHPPAKKFNAGQKIIFWAVIILGGSISASGIALMFPFEFSMFGPTFAKINAVAGTELPADLKPMQEMQLSQLWHTFVAVVLIAIILAHIYLGSLGMEGAFDAMGKGQVDKNWAKEHHSLWVEEVEARETSRSSGTPAE